MARLASIPHRWGILLAGLLMVLGSLILTDVLSPGGGSIGWIVITGLVTVPVLLRVVRGSVPDAEAEMLDRIRARMGRRSRFYSRQISKSLNKNDPILESGERVIVELHRHPLAMISPSLIAMAIGLLLKGLGVSLLALLRLAFSSILGAIGALACLAFAALLAWYVWTYRFWVLVTVAGILLIAFCVYVRLWRTHTVVVTDRHLIRFHGIRARPSRIPRSGPYDLGLTKRPIGSTVLAWLRIIKVPWDNIQVVQTHLVSDPLTVSERIAIGRSTGEIKGLIGAGVALERVAFALEWKPRAALPPPDEG